MPYVYTYPHEPLQPPRWVVLAWAVIAAAGIAAASAGTLSGRCERLCGPAALTGR